MMLLADIDEPLYAISYWSGFYPEKEVGAQFYATEEDRNLRIKELETLGFSYRLFRVMLPPKEETEF